MMNHFSKLVLFPILCLTLLNACVVRVNGSGGAPAPVPGSSVVVNTRLNLVAYPGSQLLDVDSDRDGSSKVRFSVNASLESVNAFFHREISARGWQRTRFELKSNATKIEARYARQGNDFKYKLDREGNSGRFKLEIDFDDDDDDDDDD
jgi:hypothetical protein